MLYATIAALCFAVPLGLWLVTLHLVHEDPPSGLSRAAAVHGSMGAASVVLLWLALQGPDRRGAGHGAGGFGWFAFALLAATLVGGLTILGYYLRGRALPKGLVAAHAMAGIAGAVILAAYFSSPVSYGR
jgi:hypothetical protein